MAVKTVTQLMGGGHKCLSEGERLGFGWRMAKKCDCVNEPETRWCMAELNFTTIFTTGFITLVDEGKRSC